MKNVRLVYFSGTGSTEYIALNMEEKLKQHGLKVLVDPLDASKNHKTELFTEDLLIIIFPVYAFDAPGPLYHWAKFISKVQNTPAAVISVSGGGEVWPNTASRYRLIKAVEKKGYHVFYEEMYIMPSNVFIPTVKPLAVELVKVVPRKIKHTIDCILSGSYKRIPCSFSALIVSFLCRPEKIGAKFFGRLLKLKVSCDACGLCVQNCPVGNISMKNGKPSFAWRCIMCLRCVYSCPQRAIVPGIIKFIVLKDGYNFKDYKNSTFQCDNSSIDKYAGNFLWKGVYRYLKNFNKQ